MYGAVTFLLTSALLVFDKLRPLSWSRLKGPVRLLRAVDMGLLLRSLAHLLKTLLYAVWGGFCALFSCGSRRKTPDLSADVCLVTGAGQGLGRQLALQLAECGATLVLWDIDGEKVRAVAGEIREGGREAYPYVVDCSKKEDVYRVAAQVRDEVGDVAVLVNNAGIAPEKAFINGDLKDEEIEKTYAVNALALYWVNSFHNVHNYTTCIELHTPRALGVVM